MSAEGPALLPAASTETHVRCRVCGRAVPWGGSRLFWAPDGGTVRTCGAGLVPHTAPKGAARLDDGEVPR